MSLFAAVWLYFGGLAAALAVIAALAASRRAARTSGAAAPAQFKWQCPICAYVFIEFQEQRYVDCPQCGSMLDAARDATVADAGGRGSPG